jgi:SWIM zinc finger
VSTVAEVWSAERVLALATDPAVARAGQGVARPEIWSGAGASDHAVWGLCRGAAAQPYWTSIRLDGPSYGCTCPSRKLPCKHALGLLLLWSAGAVPEGEEPPWIPAASEPRAPRRTTVADPVAAQARVARRTERVASGVAELQTWLDDRVRRGLGGFEQQGWSELNRLASRMVDAQAPGLANALRRAAATIGRGPDWPGRLLEDLAMIHLTAQAHDRLDELPAPLAETVRSRLGWTVETVRVQETGERVDDRWLVLGRVIEMDERLTTRRLWLRGLTTGRTALLLTFAPWGRNLDAAPAAPGELVAGTAAFYPGAGNVRALLIPSSGRPAEEPAGAGVAEALGLYAQALAVDPWLERWPLVVKAVRPARNGDGWALVEDGGDALEVSPYTDPWPLLALSAGEPVLVAGEWGRAGFLPMTCWHDGRAVALT